MVFFVDKWFCLNKVSLDCEVEVPELDVKGVKKRNLALSQNANKGNFKKSDSSPRDPDRHAYRRSSSRLNKRLIIFDSVFL